MWIISGQICRLTITSEMPALRASAIESSSNVSTAPTWISSGGRPRRSPYSGAACGWRGLPSPMYHCAIISIVARCTVGSVSARSMNETPFASMSTQGEMHQPPAGSVSPATLIRIDAHLRDFGRPRTRRDDLPQPGNLRVAHASSFQFVGNRHDVAGAGDAVAPATVELGDQALDHVAAADGLRGFQRFE